MKQLKMSEMTWKTFAENKEKVVILPVGATEQHGLHLPLSVDSVIAEGVALELADKIDAMIAPTLCYGYKSKPQSGGGPLFPGTIDLNGATLVALTVDILEELIADGITRIFVLNAHYENEAFILEAIDLVSRKHLDVTIVESNWWDVLSNDTIESLFDGSPFPGWAFEHAALTETSLMMYLAPELVHMELLVDDVEATPTPYHKYPVVKSMVPETGILASPKGSTAEKGEKIVKSAVEVFAKIVEDNFK